jgi:hypothetical protein
MSILAAIRMNHRPRFIHPHPSSWPRSHHPDLIKMVASDGEIKWKVEGGKHQQRSGASAQPH